MSAKGLEVNKILPMPNNINKFIVCGPTYLKLWAYNPIEPKGKKLKAEPKRLVSGKSEATNNFIDMSFMPDIHNDNSLVVLSEESQVFIFENLKLDKMINFTIETQVSEKEE